MTIDQDSEPERTKGPWKDRGAVSYKHFVEQAARDTTPWNFGFFLAAVFLALAAFRSGPPRTLLAGLLVVGLFLVGGVLLGLISVIAEAVRLWIEETK